MIDNSYYAFMNDSRILEFSKMKFINISESFLGRHGRFLPAETLLVSRHTFIILLIWPLLISIFLCSRYSMTSR